MPPKHRRWFLVLAIIVGGIYLYDNLSSLSDWASNVRQSAQGGHIPSVIGGGNTKEGEESEFSWRNLATDYPVTSFIPLPTGKPASIPKIQFDFSKRKETLTERREREKKLDTIKAAFEHSWEGYREHAWLSDEVKPLSGDPHNPFGGWGATLVDTLDTLWIMGMEKEFAVAVAALNQVDFSKCDLVSLNLFETTIRYLGGLLAAYDLTHGKYKVLLNKAVELGDMLYKAYDTPNRMPVTRWNWKDAIKGIKQSAPTGALVAELGSLTLEMGRLSQLTGDPRYFDAVQRIMDRFAEEQNSTQIPGLWPVTIQPGNDGPMTTKDTAFTFGGMADSVFEYLPKSYLLFGGRLPMYRDMYLQAIDAAKKWLIFEPLTPPPENQTDAEDLSQRPLVFGSVTSWYDGSKTLKPEGQHLTCFAGGMMAIGARMFAPDQPEAENKQDMQVAERLTAGCVWAYRSTASGVAPELYWHQACRAGLAAVTNGSEPDWRTRKEIPKNKCTWSRDAWIRAVRSVQPHQLALQEEKGPESWEQFFQESHLPEGYVAVPDPRYMLRPEAIESVFVLWRVTGDERWRDAAWDMFTAIVARARTDIAFAGLNDVTLPDDAFEMAGERRLLDSMESFWTAETLKYFYLVFADPALVSLDEYVLNTEAHPLRYRKV